MVNKRGNRGKGRGRGGRGNKPHAHKRGYGGGAGRGGGGRARAETGANWRNNKQTPYSVYSNNNNAGGRMNNTTRRRSSGPRNNNVMQPIRVKNGGIMVSLFGIYKLYLYLMFMFSNINYSILSYM